MFDIGFWELLIILVVALLVIGPERLPGLARKAGILVGKGRRFVSSVKEDIDREIAADDLRRVLKEQSESSGLHEIVEQTRDTVSTARGEVERADNEVRGAQHELDLAGNESLSDHRDTSSAERNEKKPNSAPAEGGTEPSNHDRSG